MGLTIHYPGSLNDISTIDEFAEELADIARSMKWDFTHMDEDWNEPCTAQLQHSDKGAEILGHLPLKGVTLHPGSGCESLSFLFDCKGELRELLAMVFGDQGPDQFVSTKTQFSSVDSHIWIVGLLRYLKRNYIENLEIRDEGGYWETEDRDALAHKMQILGDKISEIASGLENYKVEKTENPTADDVVRIIEDLLRREKG